MKRALASLLGLCLAAACGGDDAGTASNESGGSGGKTSSGGSSGVGSGGSAGKGGTGGATGGSAGGGGSAGSAGSFAGGTGGAGGGGGCPQQVTETKAPGTATNDGTVGFQAWTNPGYAKAADDLRATSPSLAPGTTTHRLAASAFGFQVPANATIQGIELVVERSQGGLGSAKDSSVRVLKAGAATPENPITTTTWPATDASVTYGGATSLWGTTWTPADISATDFGVWLRAQNTHATENVNPRIDSVKITIHYVFDACAP